jgi:peroxiredoxin
MPEPFSVRDAGGAKKGFADIVGEKGAVLVFVRSAAWCPFCQQQLKDIQTIAAPLRQRGYRLVSISYDAPEVLAKFAAKYAVTYDMLSDQGSMMIDAFDIRDPQYKEGSIAFGVPKPAIFVVDRGGIVRGKLAEDSYKIRPPVEAIMATVDALNPSAPR